MLKRACVCSLTRVSRHDLIYEMYTALVAALCPVMRQRGLPAYLQGELLPRLRSTFHVSSCYRLAWLLCLLG